MEMRTLESLKKILCKELDKIERKGDLSSGDLETIHKLTDTIKNLGKIEMLEDGGYSGGTWTARGDYPSKYAMDDEIYDRGNSYARRRDSMGRYSRTGYAEAEDMVIDHIKKMMQTGNLSQADRNTLAQAMNVLQR